MKKFAGLLAGVLFVVIAGCGSSSDPVPVSSDPAWGTAQMIETDDMGDAEYPQVAVDANGNAVAVWTQSDGTRNNIWANRYTAGTGWGTAEMIETDNAGNAYDPQVAVDADGNAVAVWAQNDGSRNNIWANRYTAGTGWGTAEMIETDNAGSAYDPQVAVDADGNAVAVWEQYNSSVNHIWSNRYTAGTGWGTAEMIETEDTRSAYNPQVAVDADGNAMAVWQQSDGTRYNIWSNRYTAGTGWGTAQLIETDDAGGAYDPQVAVNADGNAVAVWYQSDSTLNHIWSNRYTAGAGWGTGELIETDNTGDAVHPQVAVDAGGNAVVVWYQYDGARYHIWSNRYTAGAGWGTAELIETNNTGDAEYPQVAINADGTAVAVWTQTDGSWYNIWSNRYTAGAGWETAGVIQTNNTRDAYTPQVAVDADGNAVAVWQQSSDSDYNLWANLYR